eukprot:TRINITY_DN11846_c1_g1_i2.p1 TRINITY_DN11846_c1_g1~~TRINITY_DN11846_c1_g1_i2.p1  ORF type:complete len:250 (-),score=30.75 TRINITY_DN11846_c1_g1_i2:77-826(-)
MLPVMVGSLFIGGSQPSLRDILHASAVVSGTIIMSLARRQHKGDNAQADTLVGALFIIGSLLVDGLTGGFQERQLKNDKVNAKRIPPPALMFWSNLYQALVAFLVAVAVGDFLPGLMFMHNNPKMQFLVLRFAFCSAVGQLFIFFTLIEFGPTTLAFLTTTRKALSVLLSIALKGHRLNTFGWVGLGICFLGIFSELESRFSKDRGSKRKEELPIPSTFETHCGAGNSWPEHYRGFSHKRSVSKGPSLQ